MPASSAVSCSPARSVQQIPETSVIPYTCMKIGPNVSISRAVTDARIHHLYERDRGSGASAEEIRAAVASGLTRFKCPVRIDLEPELPRNAIGKIQKGVLRSRYAAPVA